MRKHKQVLSLLLTLLMVTGCGSNSDNDETGVLESNESAVTLSETEIFLKDYDIRGKVGGEAIFTIMMPEGVTSTLTNSDIIYPEGVSGDAMIMETVDGDIEVMLYNLSGPAGQYTLIIKGTAFTGVEPVADIYVPLALDNSYLSDIVTLNCVPSSTVIEAGGMLTGLLNYSGEVESYNLGNISVTLNGFTADIDVTLSQSSSQMLTLTNIQPIEGVTDTYFEICEGTAYDKNKAPCNDCRVDIVIE